MIRILAIMSIGLLSSAIVLHGSLSKAAPPELQRVRPLAVAPGKTTELTLFGKQLSQPQSLWTTFSTRSEYSAVEDEESKSGAAMRCRVTVGRNEQVGIGAVRAVTVEGVSNPILLMVDDLRSVGEATDHHTPDQAQLLDLPLAVDGTCDSVKEDMYRFYAAAGQRLSFEVVAQRLGSKLDSVLRLRTTGGKEIVRVDDTQGTGGDSRFSHTFETEGEYLITIEDVRHLGGEGYHYRLRVGQFPLITTVYPVGGKSGEVSSFQLHGTTAGNVSPLHVALPEVSQSSTASFGVRTEPQGGSGWFQVKSSPDSQSLEREPNDDLGAATAVAFPGVIYGRLEKPGDRDHFRFHATQGQRLHCVATTRELGSPCDLYISLHKADGSRLAVAPQSIETVLSHVIPEDGEYVLQVEDLLSGGSPAHSYRLDMKDAFLGVALHAEKLEYVAPQGGTLVVKVLAKRTHFSEPLELTVAGLGSGLKLENSTLEGDSTSLKITLPADLPQGAVRLIKITGVPKAGEPGGAVAANQRELLKALFPSTLSLPAPLAETVAIGVGPPFPPYFDLSVPGNKVYLPQLVGTSTFDIEVARINEAFQDPIALSVEQLPEGVTAEIAPVEKGLKTYRVTLKGPPSIKVGTFPIRIVGKGNFQDQTQVVTLDDLLLQITKPLLVQVKLPNPITAGSWQSAEITVRRFGAEPQPVRVRVSSGPPGLSVPISVTLAGDATETELSFFAAADAPPGKFENFSVLASTTVQGQNIEVQSEPAAGEIQAPLAESPNPTHAETPDKEDSSS